MTAPRTRLCLGCRRLTRPHGTTREEFPDTVQRATATLCSSCYANQRRNGVRTSTRKPAPPAPVYWAPPRRPQLSDCRSGCCKNPFICGRSYGCACHAEVRS